MAVEIQKPWGRVSDIVSGRFCGFLTLANRSSTPDRLVTASSPIACKIVLRGIKVVGGGIRMHSLPDGLKVPADTSLTLRPRGYHLHFLGTKPWPKVGDKVPVTLVFEKAGERKIMLEVQDPGPVGKHTLLEKS